MSMRIISSSTGKEYSAFENSSYLRSYTGSNGDQLVQRKTVRRHRGLFGHTLEQCWVSSYCSLSRIISCASVNIFPYDPRDIAIELDYPTIERTTKILGNLTLDLGHSNHGYPILQCAGDLTAQRREFTPKYLKAFLNNKVITFNGMPSTLAVVLGRWDDPTLSPGTPVMHVERFDEWSRLTVITSDPTVGNFLLMVAILAASYSGNFENLLSDWRDETDNLYCKWVSQYLLPRVIKQAGVAVEGEVARALLPRLLDILDNLARCKEDVRSKNIANAAKVLEKLINIIRASRFGGLIEAIQCIDESAKGAGEGQGDSKSSMIIKATIDDSGADEAKGGDSVG